MIEDRLGELRLRIRTDMTDATEIRPSVERIVRAVLDRCAALLEGKAPGRVVLIRHLPLRWRLDESVFDDDVQLDELASWAADAIERIAVPSKLDPPPTSREAVVFDDESHFRASHLLALARGGPSWFHAALEEPAAGDPLAALAVPERLATARDTLVRLAAEGVLAEVLAAQPGRASAELASALGLDERPPRGRSEIAIVESAAVVELTATAARWPALSPSARSLAVHAQAAVLLDAEWEAPEVVALAAAVPNYSDSRRIPRVESMKTPRRDAVVSETLASIDNRAGSDEPIDHSNAVAETEETAELFVTRCAGLFFLLDRVMELDLAELLWRACLPEGAVFASAAFALLGPSFADDTALALFGGIDGIAACPNVTPEQHAEVATATLTALAAALPRRGLADIPPVAVSLVDHPAGRLLVAAAENSPFAFFAWPAISRQMLTEGLRTLLGAWPHRGDLTAEPGLASLDSGGRVRPRREASLAALLLPAAPSVTTAALLAFVVGAPCMLFAARADASSSDTVQTFVTRYLARPARIRRFSDRMDVILDSDALDFDVRRAGLDRDPGLIPWLRRTVRFVFKERGPARTSLNRTSAEGEQ